MPMKNPSHPGRLIKSDIDALGLSIVEAAKGLGISRQQLHSVIAGRAGVTPEMAIRLEKALGSTADTWLRLQMNYDLAQIRLRAPDIDVKRMTPRGVAKSLLSASQRLDRDDAGNGLDGAGDLGRDLEAAGQFHFDLVAVRQHQNHRDFAVAVIGRGAGGAGRDRLEALGHAFDRQFAAQKDAKAFLHLGRRLIERFDRLDAGAHVLALYFGGQDHEHGSAGLEQIAILREAFGEQHRLVMAARIGQADDAHLVAGLGAALGAGDDRAGDLPCPCACLHGARKFRP